MPAKTNKEITPEESPVPSKAEESVQEMIYSIPELTAAHQEQFGCSYEVVKAALLYAGKSNATLAEAKEIVDKFRKREVK